VSEAPVVGIIMGSRSDWETMRHAAETLDELAVAYERRVISAHRTPDLLFEYAAGAEARGLHVIIAGAGGAAHLPGMAASKTNLPVLGVPVESKTLKGMDSLLSIVQMPAGVPVGTLAIGRAGAVNAALLAAAIVARSDDGVREPVEQLRVVVVAHEQLPHLRRGRVGRGVEEAEREPERDPGEREHPAELTPADDADDHADGSGFASTDSVCSAR